MQAYTPVEIRDLIKDDRIHRKVYNDPDLFALEMDRIYSKCWVFVGHDSQVPKRGDFFCTQIGLQSVVMTRDTDDSIHVLHNRCGHRGAKVVNEESGNAKRFKCLYHGWTYDMDGRLAGVVMRPDFPKECKLDEHGMQPVAEVAVYHGFVFAKLVKGGPSLFEYLGDAKQGIDHLIRAAPDGAIEFSGGFHRYEYAGNWKHQFENLVDTYHTISTHASTIGPDGRQLARRPGQDTGGQVTFIDQDKSSMILMVTTETFPNGHSATQTLIPEPQSGGIVEEYRSILAKRHGEAYATEILAQPRWNLTIYPNLDILYVQTAIRVIMPISVDRTEVRVYPVKLLGAPPAMFEEQIKYLNLTHSASSFVATDDLEAFRRLQVGMDSEGSDWCLLARGIGKEQQSNTGYATGDRASEIGQRHQYNTWIQRMCVE